MGVLTIPSNAYQAAGGLVEMHTHVGALLAIPAFLSVLLAGTLWRLIAGHLVRSKSATAQRVGGAMAVQY